MEQGSNECFMVEVPDRTAATLEAIVFQYIFPGMYLLSDSWPYGNLANIGQGIYTHSWVNHSLNFVDPNDAETHTQSIEGFWSHGKSKLQR